MNSQDWADTDSPRSQAIQQLAEICAAMGLSWSATEKQFIIELPNVVVRRGVATYEPAGGVDMDEAYTPAPTARKSFNVSNWGDVDVFGNAVSSDPIPDDFQMPDYGQKLEEGEPPKGDTDAEA